MARFAKLSGALILGLVLSGCVFHGKTDLKEVAGQVGLANVTTGDGTYENYTATGFHSATEVGIGIGIPFIVKILEIYPAKTDTQLMKSAAQAAKDAGAEAVINAHPSKGVFTGFPLFFIGIYVDWADGTGIKMMKK